MSVIDWVGVVLLVPFGFVVLGLIVSLVIGCMGSSKRRRMVLLERQAARDEARLAAEAVRAEPTAISSDAADD